MESMRGAICYYSATGNTKLACTSLARMIGGVDWELVDVIARESVDLAGYDVVGLASPTDFGGPPQRFLTFLGDLPPQEGRLAFVLNTYGMASARTLSDLSSAAEERGFTVIGGHSLRMPENYPPMIAIGLGFSNRPNPRNLARFSAYAAAVEHTLDSSRGATVMPQPVRLGFLGGLRRARERTTARKDMGTKALDAALCTECGVCEKGCPYGAIAMSPKPVFDMERCYGCWRCYNRCPEHAISTTRFPGRPFYARPSELTRGALGGSS